MSLHDKSLLISLTLTGIPSTRQDKDITRDVLFQQQADADAGRWMSRLWPRAAMEPIRSIDGQIRSFHYSKTLPWMDKGERIIASRIFTEYMEKIRDLRFKRETLVQGFIDHYDEWINQAREMRGSLFKEDEYPHRFEAARRFRCEISATPVPHKEDFRVTLASEDMAEVQASLDARVQQAETNATRDLYRRIAAPVAALVERLANPDSRLTDATLNSLRDLCHSLPDINVLDDPEIESLRQSIQSQICSLHPETLTESRSDRSRALDKANSILATMAPWMEDSALTEEAA
jgi:SpoVK/Ycf46/Vps4 family AAA+-type ATPase